MRMSQISLVSGFLILLSVPAGAQQGIHVNKATYGVINANGVFIGAYCDATPSMAAQCNGKEGCQVYVDPRGLCPDPAYGHEKSLVVVYSCDGRSETLSFPDTAQALLRCAFHEGGTPGSTVTGGGQTGTEDPVADVTWHVCAYSNPAEGCGDWRFLRNGVVQGLVGGRVVWSGRWTSLGHYLYRYDFNYAGVENHEWVRFSDPHGSGHATELTGYPSSDMTTPHRKGNRT